MKMGLVFIEFLNASRLVSASNVLDTE